MNLKEIFDFAKEYPNQIKFIATCITGVMTFTAFFMIKDQTFQIFSVIVFGSLLASYQKQLRPKFKKFKIGKGGKEEVWIRKYGEDAGSAKCPICLRNKITQTNFEVCHITAESKGGTNDLSNLTPGCSSCNKKMGTMNLNEYKRYLRS